MSMSLNVLSLSRWTKIDGLRNRQFFLDVRQVAAPLTSKSYLQVSYQ